MTTSLHKLFSGLSIVTFVGVLILPFVTFGISDPQHYSKILMVLVISIVPLAFFLIHKRALALPVSGANTLMLIFSSLGWILLLTAYVMLGIFWTGNCLDGNCGDAGGVGLVVTGILFLSAAPFSVAFIAGLVTIFEKR